MVMGASAEPPEKSVTFNLNAGLVTQAGEGNFPPFLATLGAQVDLLVSNHFLVLYWRESQSRRSSQPAAQLVRPSPLGYNSRRVKE